MPPDEAPTPRPFEVYPAAPRACSHCPWRISNQGKRSPDGWYTAANLRRLWTRLRNGDAMTCHPTDPENPLTEAQKAAGFREAKKGGKTRECTGYLILQQREAMAFQGCCAMVEQGEADGETNAIKLYRRLRPKGLSKAGLVEVIFARGIMGGQPFVGGRKMAKPNLRDPDVGYEPLDGADELIERGIEWANRGAD